MQRARSLSKLLKTTRVAAFVVSFATTSRGRDANPESASPTVTLAPAPGGDRVLFVGNSLTEANDLPLMVETCASGRATSTP